MPITMDVERTKLGSSFWIMMVVKIESITRNNFQLFLSAKITYNFGVCHVGISRKSRGM